MQACMCPLVTYLRFINFVIIQQKLTSIVIPTTVTVMEIMSTIVDVLSTVGEERW